MNAINQTLLEHAELVFYVGSAIILFAHFVGRSEGVLLFLVAVLVVVAGLFFFAMWHTPEPIRLSLVVAILVVYSVAFFVLLSEALLRGVAKFLTRWSGEKWIKEMDYFYLGIGAVGIVASINRVEFLTGRFERADIVAPLILATAVVMRVVKTRAEIAGWNTRKFHNLPTIPPSPGE
jgi:hypothetical protein